MRVDRDPRNVTSEFVELDIDAFLSATPHRRSAMDLQYSVMQSTLQYRDNPWHEQLRRRHGPPSAAHRFGRSRNSSPPGVAGSYTAGCRLVLSDDYHSGPVVWAALALWSLVRCLAFVTSRRWKLSALAAVLPVVVCLAGLNFWSFVRGCNYLGDILHFVVARPYYEHIIANLPRDGRPRLAVFNWGGSIWVSHGLVYDESDEVALPPGRQSAQWLADPRLAELDCGGFGVQPLWSH